MWLHMTYINIIMECEDILVVACSKHYTCIHLEELSRKTEL
jgi:hypothetical protein